MSEQKQNTKKLYTTPVGAVGAYPYLARPDRGNEAFPKPRGEWSCKLHVPSAKAQKMIDMLEKASEANWKKYLEVEYPKMCAEAKAKGKRPPKKFSEFNTCWYEDDEGNVVFTFKGHASFTDKKTQEVKDIVLRVYDAQGKRIETVPNINRNSEGRVEFSLVPYISAVAGVGIKLQLSKFQLLKLVEFSGGGNDTFGADMDEDYEGGYVHQEKPKDEFGGAEGYDEEPEEEMSEEDDF